MARSDCFGMRRCSGTAALLISSLLPASRGLAVESPCRLHSDSLSRRHVPVVATAAVAEPRDIIMKFGGSSVRDAERILEVCNLVHRQITTLGVRPHLVCSAMGKTTNCLLAACDDALEAGKVELSPVRDLHEATIEALGVDDTVAATEIRALLDECERNLSGVAMLGELSPRSRDKIVA